MRAAGAEPWVGRPRPAQVPLRAVRLHIIRTLLEQSGGVRTTELARRFGVSEMTTRRDLAALVTAGGCARVHGGLVDLHDEVQDRRRD